MKRKQPSTSLDAYHSVQGKIIGELQKKVLDTLTKIGSGIADEICVAGAFKDKQQCQRRMSELERLNLIEKTGDKKLTPSGRNAYVYRVVERKKPEPSSDSSFVQASLFQN